MPQSPPITAQPSPPEQAIPVPPRYWWLKRIAIALAVLLVMLGGVRWWWGVYARRALQAEIDKYVAAGQPVYEKDFLGPPIPDEQNAAILLDKACDDLILATADTSLARNRFGRWPQSASVSAGLLTASKASRAMLRQATAMRDVSWATPIAGRWARYNLLADCVARAARSEQEKGNLAECVRDTLDLLSFGRMLERRSAFIAADIDWTAVRESVDVIEAMLPDLRRPDALSRVDRSLLDRLLRELYTDEPMRAGLVAAMWRERSVAFGALAPATSSTWNTLFLPSLELDVARFLRHQTKDAEALGARNEAECLTLYPPGPRPLGRSLKLAVRPLMNCAGNFSNVVDCYWLALAHRRMAAIGLAAVLYEFDHGQLPPSLNELVPAYLPSVPENPLVRGGPAFEYLRDSSPPCIRLVGHKSHLLKFEIGSAATRPATRPR